MLHAVPAALTGVFQLDACTHSAHCSGALRDGPGHLELAVLDGLRA
jgi:hypothetical protein